MTTHPPQDLPGSTKPQHTEPPAEAAPSGRGRSLAPAKRLRRDRWFARLCVAAASVAVAVLVVLLVSILVEGLPWLSWDFITSFADPDPKRSGILPALVGSVLVGLICACTAIPLGIGTAILLEEFKPRHRLLRGFLGLIQLNISNLAGVPSIVYGILGVTVFVSFFNVGGPGASPLLSIGERHYFQYVDGTGRAYVTPIEHGAVAPRPLTADTPLFDGFDAEAPVEGLTFLAAEQTQPRLAAARTQTRAFEGAFRSAVDAYRLGPRGRGPVAITAEQAEALVDEALAAGAFRSDVASLRPRLIELTLSTDGLTSRALRPIRNQAMDLVVEQEVRSRLSGVMTLGSLPNPVSDRSWYYLSLPFGRSILAGGLTLMLVILPVVIIATQESLRAVPETMRQGVLALGGTRWQSISKIALPAAVPGICTGTILAMSRAIGEAAPLLILSGVVFISFTPANLMDHFTVMPLQIYNWASRPQTDFHHVAAAGIIVLMTALLMFNAVAVIIRHKTTRRY